MSEYAVGKRNPRKLDKSGGYYSLHVNAMTEEWLHEKSDIAAELAWRDMQIKEQKKRFIDELSIYLMDIHHGLTREDAKIVEYFLTMEKSDEMPTNT